MQDIIQRTASGIHIIPLDTVNFNQRIIAIRGEITQESAFEFAQSVQYLNSVSETEPVTVLVNSPGGSIDAGLLMYDVISSSPAPVRLLVMGMAYSMAAVIFASGSHGRYMLPHSKLMLRYNFLTVRGDACGQYGSACEVVGRETGSCGTAACQCGTPSPHYLGQRRGIPQGDGILVPEPCQ